MKRYIIVDSNLIQDLEKDTGISSIYVEIDEYGVALREVGLNNLGEIVHVFPSEKYLEGRYGVFDLVPFEDSVISDVSVELFEGVWGVTKINDE